MEIRMNLERHAVWKLLGLTLFTGGLLLVCQNDAFAFQDAAAAVEPAATESVENESSGINFLALLQRGGWFMVPLIALSLVVLAIVLERFIALRRDRIFPKRFIRQLSMLSASPGGLEPRAAYEVCQKFPSAAANVLKSALVKAGRPQAELEHAVAESSQRQATKMAQMVSWLGLAAAIAPLIGLLGTVWGITQAFYDTTQLIAGQNRAEALAEGIYTALVTTMFGLIIAIPSAVFAHFYENRIVSMMNEIEEMIFNLMPQLERYEGKIRFSDVQTESNNGESNPEDENIDSIASAVAADGKRRKKVPR